MRKQIADIVCASYTYTYVDTYTYTDTYTNTYICIHTLMYIYIQMHLYSVCDLERAFSFSATCNRSLTHFLIHTYLYTHRACTNLAIGMHDASFAKR